jgi:hypothetical protein
MEMYGTLMKPDSGIELGVLLAVDGGQYVFGNTRSASMIRKEVRYIDSDQPDVGVELDHLGKGEKKHDDAENCLSLQITITTFVRLVAVHQTLKMKRRSCMCALTNLPVL